MNAHNEQQQSREAAMVVIQRDAQGKPTVWCDPEIADLVTALNAGGIPTVASCSGHSEQNGIISLRDGRELIIASDYDTARRYERAIAAQPAAAQEAVAWQCRWLDSDNTWSEWVDGGSRREIDARIARWKADGEDHRLQVRPVFATPVAAAPVGDLFVECRQCEECNHAGVNDSGDHLAACLACYWSGMAPDEDRCPECDQTGCMSAACPKCGARYKLVASAEFPASTPAAPGIDLEQFRQPVTFWLERLVTQPCTEAHAARLREARRLLAQIDASPKPVAAPGIDLADVSLAAQMLTWGREEGLTEGQIAEIDAHAQKLFNLIDGQADASPKGDYAEDCIDRAVEAFDDVFDGVSYNKREAIAAALAAGTKDSPKGALNEQFGSAEGLGGSEARDAARWRHARRILPISVIEEGQVMLTEFGGRSSEAEILRADAAIDAAMQAQAGDAEVQP